ncbi:hypothetical protein Misp03_16700 [Microbispora sp. NBRC 16548]|nr:hypothetical protein Misp03_16700 [Microbispora sp. NBRC 16548]
MCPDRYDYSGSFAKVEEYQRRGVVYLHAVIRPLPGRITFSDFAGSVPGQRAGRGSAWTSAATAAARPTRSARPRAKACG